MIAPTAGMEAEYISAVYGRVALARAMTRGDHATREAIYPAWLEAREAEDACRLALLRETKHIINDLEAKTCPHL